jgi:hypothetical protein
MIKSHTKSLVKLLIPESQLKKSKNIFLSSNKKEINEGEIGCIRLGLGCSELCCSVDVEISCSVNGDLQTLEAEDDVRAYLSTQGLLGPAVSFLLRSVLPSGIFKFFFLRDYS